MAALSTTVGQLLINDTLPEDMRDYSRTLDKNGLRELLAELAKRHPEQYRDVSFKLGRIGMDAAYRSGGNSFGLTALRKAKVARERRKLLDLKINDILDNDSLTDEQRDKKLMLATGEIMDKERDEILEESLAEQNQLALQLKGAGRGNKMNLSSLRGSDGLYQDHRDRIIPIPVLRSYSQGLSPAEYWAGTYGARQGVMCMTGDTSVLMANYTTKPIARISVGDRVMGSDLSGVMEPVTVTAVFNQGKQDCYRYRFRKNSCRLPEAFRVLDATENHKILAQRKESRTGKFSCLSTHTPMPLELMTAVICSSPTENTFIACPSGGEINWEGKSVPEALLAGLMIGAGCIPTNCSDSYDLFCEDDLLLHDTRDYLASFNLQLCRTGSKQCSYVLEEIEKSGDQYSPAKLWLLYNLSDTLSHEQELPEDIYKWDFNSTSAFVRGLCSVATTSSGRKDSHKVRISLNSYKLASQLQRLLELRFGIWTGLLRLTTGRNGCRDKWSFSLNHPDGTKRFATRIGMVGIKRIHLDQLLRYSSSDPDNNEFGFKLVDREYLGKQQTFDIEVDYPTHLFVLANGLVVSNSVKFATQDSGSLSKQLAQISHRQVVTDVDRDGEPDTLIGYPTDVDDNDNEGALFATDTGGYKRNTVITPKILADLRRRKIKRILVRSPVVSGSPDGGIYARDAGVREFGQLPVRGENVGITAAQALSEPVTQGALSAKHTGGVAGESKSVSGFDRINQLIQTPKTFKGGAAHATVDGKVQRIEKAPAGGHFVTIDNQQHYISTGFNPSVAVGDEIEAGDVLSDGIPNPAVITQYKGIGEGRHYFIKAFIDTLREAGMSAHRRNVELLSRGLINHVRLTDEIGDFAPDDIVPYSALEHAYRPRENGRVTHPRGAVGQYLERPYLHYSIGTRVKPSMLKDFNEFGVKQLAVHQDPPPFEPEMIRGMANLHHDPDWQTRMFGTGLKGSVLQSVHLGGTSDEQGTSFVPGRARAVDFGRSGGPVQNPKRNLGY